jgi:hypothetical protein
MKERLFCIIIERFKFQVKIQESETFEEVTV